jgi:hypothetical protein
MKPIFKLFFAILALATLAAVVTGNVLFIAVPLVASAFLNSYKTANANFYSFIPASLAGPAFTRAQKYLLDWLAQFGNDVTKKAVASGSIVWDPITYYIRYAITGLSGRQKILGSATSKVDGVCNLDKGQLPQYYNFCYDRIAVRYGSTNTANSTVQNFAGYSSVLSSMDAALRNAELIVSLNQEIQVKTPIIDFGAEAAITGGAGVSNVGGELATPKVWVEQLQIEAEILFPNSTTVASAVNTFYFAEVAFMGIQARLG